MNAQTVKYQDGILVMDLPEAVIRTTGETTLEVNATAHIREGRPTFPFHEPDTVTGYTFTINVYVTAPEGQEMWQMISNEAAAERKQQ